MTLDRSIALLRQGLEAMGFADAEFRASPFNAMNTPLFDTPNTNPASPRFGVAPNTLRNLPRSIELGVRYAF